MLKRWIPVITRDRSWVVRYGFALVLSASALMLNVALRSAVERNLFFMTIVPVVVVSVAVGYGPGVLTTLCTAFGMNFFFLGSGGSAHFESVEDFIRIALFTIAGLLLTGLGGALREALLGALEARKVAEAALRERDEFISIVSHELKTPLTGLKLRAELEKRAISQRAKESMVSRDEHENFVNAADQTVERLRRLVEDLLDLSRLTHGRLKINLESINLKTIIQTVVERFGSELEEKGIQLRTVITSDVIGNWDPLRIDQVITNLLSNAIKYGERQPIELGIKKMDSKVVISVRDNGPGISSENLTKVFQRFERFAGEKSISGMGLGLYITRNLVELHKGRIWVQSQSGRGTTFFVELPTDLGDMAPDPPR
ncbi:MAG TPA: ATP-binding protein [Bdellovibrionota bacterium]|nr:ATP-binding protein [Bdellovibrionota bacterium]